MAFYYVPNEIQLFLLDYKEGVEFNAYAKDAILEHARLVSVASSVGFGVSFLSWLDKETKKRDELFKQFNVKDLSAYRKHGEMPRLIIKRIYKEFNQRNLVPIEHKIYNGETALKMPNTLKANEMRLHLGKEVDYDQKDLIVEFENNESHLLVVSQDLNARIALMKLFA
ncbi:hypothetical protein ID0007_09920 [Helicobacter pylori]